MESATDQGNSAPTTAHRVNWFAPDRPVDGATVFVQPPVDASNHVADPVIDDIRG
jgi:hypothetical protein